MRYLSCFLIGILLGVIGARKYVLKEVHREPNQLSGTLNKLSSTSIALSHENASIYNKFPHFNQVEYVYQSTFRNCLGNNCFNAEVTNTETQKPMFRVGILGMPKSGTESLLGMLKRVTKPEDFLNSKVSIDASTSTHVPPYGYGKNHGWSSIVRISRRVVQHSYALVEDIVSSSEESSAVMDIQVECVADYNAEYLCLAADEANCAVAMPIISRGSAYSYADR